MKPPRPRIHVNLEELDRVLDGARQVPLSDADCEKVKVALHALAAMLPAARTTEKTSAVFEESQQPKTDDQLRRRGTHRLSRRGMDATGRKRLSARAK